MHITSFICIQNYSSKSIFILQCWFIMYFVYHCSFFSIIVLSLFGTIFLVHIKHSRHTLTQPSYAKHQHFILKMKLSYVHYHFRGHIISSCLSDQMYLAHNSHTFKSPAVYFTLLWKHLFVHAILGRISWIISSTFLTVCCWKCSS